MTPRIDSRRGFARTFRLAAVCLAACLGALSIAGCRKEETVQAPPPPPEVEVVAAQTRDVPILAEWIGVADGLVNAKIRAQVGGYLLRQNYKEGSLVKKGDLLFEIDPRPFVAALAKAEAQLAQARSQQATTDLYVKRYEPLVKQGAISRQQYDDAVQNDLSAKAGVQSAQAAVEEARLNLDFTKIISPIDGVAGAANVQIGDLVGSSSSTELTTVSTLDPIKVFFPISESEYLNVARDVQRTQRMENEPPAANLDLIMVDGTIHPYKGAFSFADRQIDVKTGAVRIAALFPNPDNILKPGQFARVRALVEVKKNATVIPQRAVTDMQGTMLVAVVGPGDVVEVRPVKAGVRNGPDWVIESGLKPGERVVVEGTQKARPGTKVRPKPLASAEPAKRG